jgi:hypothetical protein
VASHDYVVAQALLTPLSVVVLDKLAAQVGVATGKVHECSRNTEYLIRLDEAMRNQTLPWVDIEVQMRPNVAVVSAKNSLRPQTGPLP